MTEANIPKILAVIPARGGSKGIPRKNIREVAGKPMITHSIMAALGAHNLYKLIVSTDDQEIAEIARAAGAEIPFMRPPELATDEAGSLGVMQHAAREVEKMEEIKLDWTLLIQPTNPLATSADIDSVIDLALKNKATSVVSVKEAQESHPYMVKIIAEGLLKPFMPDTPSIIRRQDLCPAVYKRNGSLYMTRRDILEHDLYGDTIVPYIMPAERSIDIDSELDLKCAELILKERQDT